MEDNVHAYITSESVKEWVRQLRWCQRPEHITLQSKAIPVPVSRNLRAPTRPHPASRNGILSTHAPDVATLISTCQQSSEIYAKREAFQRLIENASQRRCVIDFEKVTPHSLVKKAV
ncbi:hypothetical protein RvY_01293 [Ramazzottius varieornatus]|uniref:Uncharacterized protein n=1 Tax=Ramazzottius varieornatus TaxID=947166 RepID=A0A1D1UG55_RAMVA|nr:hypothetical protein RvY_01293 [Ramazzottius varieornatus]